MIPPLPIDAHILSLIKMAVREDLGGEPRGTGPKRGHDLTVEISIPENSISTGRIIAKKEASSPELSCSKRFFANMLPPCRSRLPPPTART